jgi:hypothetical protein
LEQTMTLPISSGPRGAYPERSVSRTAEACHGVL